MRRFLAAGFMMLVVLAVAGDRTRAFAFSLNDLSLSGQLNQSSEKLGDELQESYAALNRGFSSTMKKALDRWEKSIERADDLLALQQQTLEHTSATTLQNLDVW